MIIIVFIRIESYRIILVGIVSITISEAPQPQSPPSVSSLDVRTTLLSVDLCAPIALSMREGCARFSYSPSLSSQQSLVVILPCFFSQQPLITIVIVRYNVTLSSNVILPSMNIYLCYRGYKRGVERVCSFFEPSRSASD